jgi:hypothetical protein
MEGWNLKNTVFDTLVVHSFKDFDKHGDKISDLLPNRIQFQILEEPYMTPGCVAFMYRFHLVGYWDFRETH